MAYRNLSESNLFQILNENKAINITGSIETKYSNKASFWKVNCFINGLDVATAFVVENQKECSGEIMNRYQIRVMNMFNSPVMNIPLLNLFCNEQLTQSEVAITVSNAICIYFIGGEHWGQIPICKENDAIFLIDYSFYTMVHTEECISFEYDDLTDDSVTAKALEEKQNSAARDYKHLCDLLFAPSCKKTN